jgi:hypothetical protein
MPLRYSQASRKRLTLSRDDTAHLRVALRHAEIAKIKIWPDVATQQGVLPQTTHLPTLF